MVLLSKLRLKHKAQDVYVLGSGPSLGYVNDRFLNDKIIICVNNTIDFVTEAQHMYLVAKEPTRKMQEQIRQKNGLLVTCERRFGGRGADNEILYPDQTVLFQPREGAIKDVDQLTCLERSASTMSTAIHLAAFLGAKTILLIGHDCGKLDEKVHADDYDKSEAVTPESYYSKWMGQFCVEQQTLVLKQILKIKYDIEMYSVNPFINFGLEGHSYQSFSS